MSERLYRQQPDIDYEDRLAAIPLEIAEDFSLWTAELEEGILDLTSAELTQLAGENQPETLSLKEQYNLPFEPMETIRGIGSVGLLMAMTPDALSREIQGRTLDAVAEVEEAESEQTAGEYAQDKPEYQEYVRQAESIVNGLLYGDEGGLGVLPADFQDALSTRMSQRCQELDDGTMSDGEFSLEVKKMISVACEGLRQASDLVLR